MQPSVWDLHRSFGGQLLDLLATPGPPLVLFGNVGSGTGQLVRGLAGERAPSAVLDPLIAQRSEELAAQIVRDLVAGSQPLAPERLAEPTREAERFRVHVAHRYGDDATEAVRIYGGDLARGWSIARAIGRDVERPLIVVPEAHRLAPEPLWELRDLALRGAVDLLLTSRLHHGDRLVGQDAPLFGGAQALMMPGLSPKRWTEVLGAGLAIHPADVDWLLEATRGRTATMLEVLAAWPEGQSPRYAWHYAARSRIPQAEQLLGLGRTLHDYAPRLLTAIAAGDAPYAAIEGARSNRIAKALGLLHDLDLIEQPRPRRWQIADPLLEASLRVVAERKRLWSLAR